MKILYRNTKNVDIFSSLLMTKHAKIKILPALYWIPFTVLMLSPTVLMLSPTCTDVIPLMYWITLHSTEAIPHCTDVIPPLYWTTSTVVKVSPTVLKLSPHMYSSYPPTCTAVIPPQYWCYPHSTDGIPLHVLMLSPTVLNNLHSTEGIPPQVLKLPPLYWSYPPQYWC